MNTIFNASAGTGKTWQVTELYSALVLGLPHPQITANCGPISPEKILLMTFTDNAASELRERVSEKMLAAERSDDFERAELARSVLRRLPAANISTIHAFCAGLLREHALALGLSPAFQTLDEEARNELLNEVLKRQIFDALEFDPEFQHFCTGLSVLGDGDYSVIGTIRKLIEAADSRGLDCSRAEALLPVPQQTVQCADFEALRDELASFNLSQSSVLAAQDALARCLADFPNGLDQLKKFGRVAAVKHLSDRLFELKELFLIEERYREHLPFCRSFARCLARCVTEFRAAKRKRDAVDFGDQLLLARDLLQTAGGDLAPFEWIIVDEVQDTSRVQCDMIKALWRPESQLVICGDKKQSIYAWRSADPDVMPDLEAMMHARGSAVTIPLQKSYRSKDRVIAAVNEIFSGLYNSYDALEPLSVLDGEVPCIEFLTEGDAPQGVAAEMDAVARRIQLLVHGDAHWRPRFGYDGTQFVPDTPVHYRDILILLKRSAHQTVLERALRAAGIPCTSGGKGRALFEQQEVRDVLLFLQAISQPGNDLALVGFLRSPMMGVSDDELVQFGWDGERFDPKALRTHFMQTDRAERLVRFRAAAATQLVSQLVRDLICETAYDAFLAGEPGGDQKLANLKKLIDWLRAAERGGSVLLGDVVRRFERAVQSPPKSGSAEAMLPDPKQNAVTVMTVHGAKGLTKRICFVPDISFRESSDKGFALFSKQALELKWSGLDGRVVETPGWKAAKEANKAVRARELINVFYVAMTRARDLTVISGWQGQRPEGWMKLIQGFLDTARPEILKRIRYEELPVQARPSAPRSDSPFVADDLVPLTVPRGLQRMPVTRLVRCEPTPGEGAASRGDRRAFGTLGHVALEELARCRWMGDVGALLANLDGRSAFSGELCAKVQSVAERMRAATHGASALFPEHSFVLRRGAYILDGTIDLLVQFEDHWAIFDYKFSDATPQSLCAMYRPQLLAYREAVERLYPGALVRVALVLIGSEVQIVDVQ